MKEMIIRVPEDSVAFAEEFVERIGGDVETVKTKKSAVKKKKSTLKKEEKISPTFLFGKWKDLDLDPVTYRDKLWPRKKL